MVRHFPIRHHWRRHCWWRPATAAAQMPNLRCRFDENRKTFHPFNRVRANVWQRRIFIGLSVPTAPAETLDAYIPSGEHSHTHTHTRTDNLAISAKPYYTEISRHGETTDCVNGKCHSLHSHFKIGYAIAEHFALPPPVSIHLTRSDPLPAPTLALSRPSRRLCRQLETILGAWNFSTLTMRIHLLLVCLLILLLLLCRNHIRRNSFVSHLTRFH